MVLQVKSSILGFESLKSVVLSPIDELFSTLSAEDESQISFTICNAYALMPDYDFEITDELKELLEITPESSFVVYSMVTIQDPIEASGVNLLAPVIINLDKQLLGQISLSSLDYPNYDMNTPLSSFKN